MSDYMERREDLLFVSGLIEDREAVNEKATFHTVKPPEIPLNSRGSVMSNLMAYGQTGKGKTVAISYWTILMRNLKAPQFGVPNGFKILWIDFVGKGEMACAFLPMDKSHSMYPLLKKVGLEPESYPVEVLRPLVWVRGEPDLVYEQPDIVKPFTLALSDITITEWGTLLTGGLSSGQTNLLNKALGELEKLTKKEMISIQDVIVKCQETIAAENVEYIPNIPGMKNVKGIKYAKTVFTAKEGKGLLQKLEGLANTGLIQPTVWNGEPVPTNLDLASVLRDYETISVLLVPRYKDLPHLNLSIVNYVLSHLYNLKSPNNRNRIKQPICITIPELRKCVPKGTSGNDRYFIEPLKNTLLELNSVGNGIGITLVGDTQTNDQIDPEYRTNVGTQFIFDLGEKADEKIKEILKNRFVTNLKEITDPKTLRALKDTGTFIFLGANSWRAEIRKNALVGFWYPRSRGKKGESETNFYDLFQQTFPDRMNDIRPQYNLLVQITQSTQTSASDNMDIILEEKEQKKVVGKLRKNAKGYLGSLERLAELSASKTFWEFKELVADLVKETGKSRSQASRDLAKLETMGYLFVDVSGGQKRKKVTLYPGSIREALKKLELAPKKEKKTISPKEEKKVVRPPPKKEAPKIEKTLNEKLLLNIYQLAAKKKREQEKDTPKDWLDNETFYSHEEP